MAKKKDRAFFICPRWSEVEQAARNASPASPVSGRLHRKTLAAIAEGRPLARSTLRKALLAERDAAGLAFDVDAYLVDQRRQ